MLEKQDGLPLTSTPTQHVKRRQPLRDALLVFTALALLAQVFHTATHCQLGLPRSFQHGQSANSTLGFGAIYAVSQNGSPRRDPLLRAAMLTELDLTIPSQPEWSDSEIERLKAPKNSTVQRGSALAWLGHLNALRSFLDSHNEAALIVEDDIDWDTRIRTQQIPRTAHAIRELLSSQGEGYYGDTNHWDVIWLGHCGDFFSTARGSRISAIKSFTDLVMPPLAELHPWTQDFMIHIGAVEDHQRLVHESVQPLCSFAYAITRSAAEKIVLELAAREPTRPLDQACSAYDVRLLEACRDHGFKCITVNPELFHHSTGQSEIGLSDVEDESSGRRRTGTRKEASGPGTPNIRCSARSSKWWDLRSEVTEASLDPDKFIRELAGSSSICAIDDLA